MPVGNIGTDKLFGWRLGMPGMVADTTYKHNRQAVYDNNWINKGTDLLRFGTAVFIDANGNLVPVAKAKAQDAKSFVGVVQDDEKHVDTNSYKQYEFCTIFTLGDIWVLTDPAITIKHRDSVFVIGAAGATQGFFSNVVGTGGIEIPEARFISPNQNGCAVISITRP